MPSWTSEVLSEAGSLASDVAAAAPLEVDVEQGDDADWVAEVVRKVEEGEGIVDCC